MAKQLFSNNASSLLAASIDDNDLAIQVGVGDGALFPNPGAGEFFLAALVNAAGDYEIVRIESRSTDILTVASGGRGQDGTAAQSWTNGLTRVELRNTAATMENFIQRGGDVMEGDLDMDSNDIVDASLTGDWKGTNGQLVGTALRGTEDDSSNEVKVPSGGGRATAGGSVILTANNVQGARTAVFEVGMIMEWFGAAVACPAGWAICDGTNGTPDMRDRVSVGVSGSKALNATGGAETATGSTGLAGGHTHGGGTTGSHALTVGQMPAHAHGVQVWTSNSSDGTHDGWGRFAHMVMAMFGLGGAVASFRGYKTHDQGGAQLIQDAGLGQAHSHSITAENSHSHNLGTISVMQPYRALHKIMFIGY